MNRTFYLFLLLAALRLTGAASEEEFVPWQSVTVKSPELPAVGIVTIKGINTKWRFSDEVEPIMWTRNL